MLDAATVEVYERQATEWEATRRPRLDDARRFAANLADGDRPVLDVGCGPGWVLPAFPGPKIGLDAADAFVRRIPTYDPSAVPLRADLARLPFRRQQIGAAWADRSIVHLPRTAVPLALWELHRALRPGAPVALRLFEGADEFAEVGDERFPGRRFSLWPRPLLEAVLLGAGLVDVSIREDRNDDETEFFVEARRGATLADSVGAGMRLLCVGLNPSPYAAEIGVGFARPGNRFWPAALSAGVVSADRDPRHALDVDGVGMTDLVKRPTARADEITPTEYRAGIDRLDLVCGWLQPRVVCIVGLAGWRVAVDRRATTGWQPWALGGRPTYVMPNPSGLNAHETVASLSEHLRHASEGPR